MIDNTLVKRSTSTKLLGLTIDDKLNWNEQINGSNGYIYKNCYKPSNWQYELNYQKVYLKSHH